MVEKSTQGDNGLGMRKAGFKGVAVSVLLVQVFLFFLVELQ